jgi:hypothetical protein
MTMKEALWGRLDITPASNNRVAPCMSLGFRWASYITASAYIFGY